MKAPFATLLLACALLGPSAARAQSDQRPQVLVVGRGESVLPPDHASIRVAMESRASTAAAAGSQNAARTRAIRAAIEAIGIAPDSVTTSGYSVQPYHQSGLSERVEGYLATNVMLVRTGRLEQVGRIIDTALGAGANRIENVQFTTSRSSEARRAALADAVRDAREQAEALADAAGARLGEILEMSTQGNPMGYVISGEAIRIRGASSNSTPVNAADVQVGAAVTIRYALVAREAP